MFRDGAEEIYLGFQAYEAPYVKIGQEKKF